MFVSRSVYLMLLYALARRDREKGEYPKHPFHITCDLKAIGGHLGARRFICMSISGIREYVHEYIHERMATYVNSCRRPRVTPHSLALFFLFFFF